MYERPSNVSSVRPTSRYAPTSSSAPRPRVPIEHEIRKRAAERGEVDAVGARIRRRVAGELHVAPGDLGQHLGEVTYQVVLLSRADVERPSPDERRRRLEHR